MQAVKPFPQWFGPRVGGLFVLLLCLAGPAELKSQPSSNEVLRSAGEVRRLAHSCAGASATCGMRRLVPLLRELERQGLEGKLAGTEHLCAQVSREFVRVRQFLEANVVAPPELLSRP